MMPPDTEARLNAAISRVAETLSDGFNPMTDIDILIRQAVEIVETFGDLDGTEKKALALAFLERVLDEHFEMALPTIDRLIEDLDLPGPQLLERFVWDPWLKEIAPGLMRSAMKKNLPRLVDLVVDAAAGALEVNRRNSQ